MRSKIFSVSGGMAARLMPWKPSAPAMRSQVMDFSAPSWRKRMMGDSVSMASMAVAWASK
jgi:hypothetical protein